MKPTTNGQKLHADVARSLIDLYFLSVRMSSDARPLDVLDANIIHVLFFRKRTVHYYLHARSFYDVCLYMLYKCIYIYTL